MSWTQTPRDQYPELFEAVQSGHVFDDSKTFVDAIPRRTVKEINRAFRRDHRTADFDIKAFVLAHFDLPEEPDTSTLTGSHPPVVEYIEALWKILTRAADDRSESSSLIPLPRPYVVPGGRFREIYYWDSYFTMLGLAQSGHVDRVRDMVDNFAYLIDEIGFVPNGNRSYFCSRSQPPFFSLMVELLAECHDDPSILVHYQPQLLGEYEFWMSGAASLQRDGDAHRRVVRTSAGVLNRYWDDDPSPRQESYAEDVSLAGRVERDSEPLYRDVRAACESGWDFSSRWFADGHSFETVCTTSILPVDLNALMYNLERRIADNFAGEGNATEAAKFAERADARRQLLTTLFFDDDSGVFVDVRCDDLRPTGVPSLAMVFPLFFGISSKQQAGSVARALEQEYLCPGGWVTTRQDTGQQWDAPNGWAPLQWIVYRALCDYGYDAAAREGAARWINNNRVTYESTGRLLEKYDVVSAGHAGVGGEYVVQDGFGWTNGVLLRMMRELDAGA
ncbi:MAG: alpha,alpha-trehalase TreF [Woeseiaceae bacterium]|nr:alpha,alpha-trehalase TreF [Woeseiaceae bacterium]